MVAAAWIVPALTLRALFDLNVPLGESGAFVYRYSVVWVLRLERCWPLIPLTAAAVGAAWLFARSATRHWLALGASAIVIIGLAAWTWWLPPEPVSQHFFNFSSPSQDGAFVLEAREGTPAPEYLHGFDARLRRSPAEMQGTRVLSNPPGMTILAIEVSRWIRPHLSPPGPFERLLLKNDVPTEGIADYVETTSMSAILCALWALSAVFAYLLGRLWLSPAGAALLAVVVTFNPATVNFSPGKDAAQLLTINAMLWAWFAAWRQARPWLATVAGAVLVVGLCFGLIHLWIAIAALAATAWEEKNRRRVIQYIFLAAAGALAVVGVVYLAIGWNIPGTLWAVSRRYADVQKTIHVNHVLWFFIGLPLFLLFLSPGVWTIAALDVRRPRRGFGRRLLICTAAVMLFTYLIGVTYELPRLWIAFLPELTLAVMADRPLLHGRTPRRTWRAIALIAVAQISLTAIFASFLDVRESDYRLFEHRLYGSGATGKDETADSGVATLLPTHDIVKVAAVPRG